MSLLAKKSTLYLLGVLALLVVGVHVEAADYCRFYANADFQGDHKTYGIPSGSYTGISWAPGSRSRFGPHLDRSGPVYRQAEGLRMVARDTDVSAYLFDGDHFDGRFKVYRCEQGRVCVWRFPGSWRDRVRSFICQRDDFISNGLLSSGLQSELMRNHLLPTALLADPLTARIHDDVRDASGSFFYGLDLKYGRIVWSNRDDLCGVIRSCENVSWRDRYRDYLRYEYKVEGRLRLDGLKYRIYVKLWVEPVLRNGSLEFVQRGWSYRVTGGAYRFRIGREVRDQIERVFPDLGDELTTSLRQEATRLLGGVGASLLLDGNERLLVSHPCSYLVQRVGNPGHTYTSEQIRNICGGSTPVHAAAPALRLLKD